MINAALTSALKTTQFSDENGNLTPIYTIFLELVKLDQSDTNKDVIIKVQNRITYLNKSKLKLELTLSNMDNDLQTIDFDNKYSAFNAFNIANYALDTASMDFFNNVNVSLSSNMLNTKNLNQELQIVNYKLKILNDYLTTLYSTSNLYTTIISDLTKMGG